MSMSEQQFLDALGVMNAGVFMKLIREAMSDVALGTAVYGDGRKKGKLILSFTFARQGETTAVNVEHAIEYKIPTSKGSRGEVMSEMTPFHVKAGGVLGFMKDDSTEDWVEQARS